MRDFLEKVFKDYTPGINDEDSMKRSAVIIPVINVNGTSHILFEVRTDKLTLNPGEICFPGGAIENGESPKDAALRECFEEIGVGGDNISIISKLDIFVSNTNIIIYPFLAHIKDDVKFLINKDEVKNLLIIPLDYLIKHEPISVKNKVITVPGDNFPFENVKDGINYKFRDGNYRVLFYKYGQNVIWGITARILENFLNVIKNK
ncbi:NUDIX hydrolase [Clostridium sp.]|uniref:NUDIX hydrolase n=1 Tax=Clostridium sp. TaxID=1506 RepID=UPI002FCB8DC2